MPAKLKGKGAPKKTSESGPSAGANQWPEILREWKIDGQKPSLDQKNLIFYLYKEFRHKGRPLSREELFDMVAMILKKKTFKGAVYASLHGWFDMFNDDDHPATKVLADSLSNNEQQQQQQLDKMFEEYLENDAGAKDRCENYEGL